MSEAFERLNRKVQKFIRNQEWTKLRHIQSESIDTIFETDRDLLLSAPTASGKTEAAFMPTLSKVLNNPGSSVRILYVGPLKALINDQFRRIEEDLCRHADLPVFRWHGDVSSSRKRRLVEQPGGVLLITPESIESLFINRTRHLGQLFAGLDFVIIDEIHSFMGTERGAHLRSLLSRLDQVRGQRARRIGLSATIGEPIDAPKRWLAGGDDREVEVIRQESTGKLQAIVHGYKTEPANLDSDEAISEQDLDDELDVARDIFGTIRGKTNLIFGNSKADLESLVDTLNELCRDHRVPEEFLIHHGSLDKSIREEAEARMQGRDPATTLCTNTLELGIDVGLIDTVGQLDPPWTVSSLAQRVGRSGRHAEQPSRLRFFVREEASTAEADLVDRIYPRLIQSIAMVQLFAIDSWCEPFRYELHYSTLVQQILSVLRETGGTQADRIYRTLVVEGPFAKVAPDEFAALLRRMATEELVMQMPGTGNLILDVAGERIVNHFRFYAAFRTPETYDVRTGKDRIGEVDPTGIEKEDHLLLGGRRWEVLQVRDRQKELLVEPTAGKKPPHFSTSGIRRVHERIRQKMRAVLLSGQTPSFLDDKAVQLLEYAQSTAREADLANKQILERGRDTLLFHWTGDRIIRTVLEIAGREGLETEIDPTWTMATFSNTSLDDFRDMIETVARRRYSDIDLAESTKRPKKTIEKYDQYLTETLLNRQYARNHLDVDAAADWAEAMLDRSGGDGNR